MLSAGPNFFTVVEHWIVDMGKCSLYIYIHICSMNRTDNFQFGTTGGSKLPYPGSVSYSVFTSPPVAHLNPIAIRQSVYLFVCLTAKISQNPYVQISLNSVRYMWPLLGPTLTAMKYIMYFRFCGWRHVSIMEGIVPNQRRHVFRPVRQVVAPRAKSTVSDCILFSLSRTHFSVAEQNN